MRGDIQSFADLYLYIQTLPENETFLNHLEAGKWKHCSLREFVQKMRYLSLSFEARGWRGKQVAIAIRPSIYWLLIDYALMLSGCVSVPLFTNISTKNLRFVIDDADLDTVFTQTKEQERLIREADASIVCIDIDSQDPDRESLDTFIRHGQAIDQKSPEKFEALLSAVSGDDLLTIVYTSGTSGLPKGVELTHINLISQIIDTGLKYKFDSQTDRALSFLPLAHIFERMVMHFYLSTGIRVYFADDVKNVGNLLRDVHPTVMTVVPRLLEKVYFKMYAKAMEGSLPKRVLVKIAFTRAAEKAPSKPKSFFESLLDKLVYSKLRDSLGGSLRMMISGGAALSGDLNRFFINIGIPTYQGYGLTESSPVICANAPGENKIGTCGKPFVHTEVKIAKDKELLARGPGIMRGYHNNAKATEEAIDSEGWLHTGDLASMDEEGYITITGRKKDLAKTSTGEFISVNFIEQLLIASGWFDHVLIVGNDRPFVVALLILDEDRIKVFAQKYGFQTIDEAIQSKAFGKRMQVLIAEVNKKLNYWERIRDFHPLSRTLTIEEGDLTPSMKLAREQMQKHFEKEIEAMYAEHV